MGGGGNEPEFQRNCSPFNDTSIKLARQRSSLRWVKSVNFSQSLKNSDANELTTLRPAA